MDHESPFRSRYPITDPRAQIIMEEAWAPKGRWVCLKKRVLPEPLPCPFCGATPSIYPVNPAVEGNCGGRVVCENPQCHANPEVHSSSRLCADCGPRAYIEIAIRHWNRRNNP